MTGRPVFVEVINGEPHITGSPLYASPIDTLVRELDRLASDAAPHLVVTVNVDQVLEMKASPRFLEIVQSASLRTIDGAPLAALSSLLGARQAHRNTGADLLPALAESASVNGRKIVILGGADDVSSTAAVALRSAYPGLKISEVPFPFVDSVQSESLAQVPDALRSASPDFVFVCLGSPKQELWFDHWKDLLPAAVYIGAGAAVDFAAGRKSRAPKLIQRLGLEWLWRLLQEPRRLFSRYLIRGPRFIIVVLDSFRAKAKGLR